MPRLAMRVWSAVGAASLGRPCAIEFYATVDIADPGLEEHLGDW
jgi:hypothetical protein